MALKMSLKKYILAQISALFGLITIVVVTYSTIQKHKNMSVIVDNFILNSGNQVINDICKIIKDTSDIEKTIDGWMKDQQKSLSGEPDPLFKAVFANLKENDGCLTLNRMISTIPALATIQIANEERGFIQIKKYTEQNTIPITKMKYQTKDKAIPKNTSYTIRNTISIHGEYASDRWRYFSNDDRLLVEEINENSSYNPIKRPWFENIGSNEMIYHMTSIYTAGSTVEIPVLTISKGIVWKFKQPKKCVVSADISSKYLSFFLNNKRITNNCFFIIYDMDKNTVISSLDNDRSIDTEKIKNQAINLLYNSFPENGCYQLEHDNIKYKLTILEFPYDFAAITGKVWFLILATPEEEINKIFDDYVNNSDIIMYLIIMLTSIIQIIIISRKLSDPIAVLTAEALKIYKFDFSSNFVVNTPVSELNALGDIIQSMKISLNSFSRYIPKKLVTKLIDKSKNIELGGELKTLTILFSDIENFTTVSEKLSPKELTTQISEYFEKMARILMDQNATIDKYIGDSVMAFWGAPDEDLNQAYNACHAALKFQVDLAILNEQWVQEGKPAFKTRIGLHKGQVVVGNVGSADRINYTIWGDSVNIASRLEGTNKIYKSKIIISKDVFESIKNDFIAMPLDVILVKGKNIPIKIYELIGHKENDDPRLIPAAETLKFVDGFSKFFDFYTYMNFELASDILKCLTPQTDTQNLLIEIYTERCKKLLENRPAENWDRVFI